MKLIKTEVQSIYYTVNKNDTISYYGSYKDPNTKQSKRKKLITINKSDYNFKSWTKNKIVNQCKNDLMKLIEDTHIENNKTEEQKREEQKKEEDKRKIENKLTLNDLSRIYFDYKVKQKEIELKSKFSNRDFENDKMIQRKIYNVKKEELRFKKNVSVFDIVKIPIVEMTKKDVNDYLEKDLLNLNLSEKSLSTVESMIRTIINHSIKEDIIDCINPFKNQKFKNPKNKRMKSLTELELKLLLNECEKYYDYNPNIYLSVYLGILTGGRLNSILNLRKKDFLFNNKMIKMTNFKVRNSTYFSKIDNESCKYFEKILEDWEDEEYIIRPMKKYRDLDKYTFQPMKDIPQKLVDIMDEMFNKGLNKQNNEDRNFCVNFHTLRRSVSTNMVNNGYNIYDVMLFLNHSSINQTMDYLSPTINNLNKLVENNMNNVMISETNEKNRLKELENQKRLDELERMEEEDIEEYERKVFEEMEED